jgi:hypothetical protein
MERVWDGYTSCHFPILLFISHYPNMGSNLSPPHFPILISISQMPHIMLSNHSIDHVCTHKAQYENRENMEKHETFYSLV